VKSKEEIKKIALNTIEVEAKSISNLKSYINDNFFRCVETIYRSNGRVVITGVGKSAIIANKIVATLNSTGTPATFMHAADAIHGDLGIIQKDDVIICISNSGNTSEVKILIPMLKTLGACLIGMVGNLNSYLARQADLVINTTVEEEAGPGNLAPTSSTTAQLVIGDTLAVTLLHCHGFTTKDFARYHPGGSLGKQLYLKASDLYINNELPQVNADADLRTVILEISSKRLGATAVKENQNITGIITDGDLRRMLEKTDNINNIKAKDIMSKNPKTIKKNTLAVDALQIMRQHNITQLLVLDKGEYVGVVHLHDIINEGII